jgi:hypothetical protein
MARFLGFERLPKWCVGGDQHRHEDPTLIKTTLRVIQDRQIRRRLAVNHKSTACFTAIDRMGCDFRRVQLTESHSIGACQRV